MSDTLKTCGKCKQELPREQFSKNKSAKDGLDWTCKGCTREHHRAWLINLTPEKRAIKNARQVKWVKANNWENHLASARKYNAKKRAEKLAAGGQ